MRAAVYRADGVLSVEDVETPEPGPGEVRVRVTVSGVNPTDWKARAAGAELQVPNQDGAGVIESVGPGVDAARVGERVWIYFAAWQRPWGTAAEYTVVPAEQAVPFAASDDLGASLGIPALTAYHCLLADGPIEGRTVLVAGGAGAVGHAAIELARWAGARVVSTVSSDEKAALAREAGADAVVNYRDGDAVERIRAAAPDGVDRVVEVDLKSNTALDLDVAAANAVIASYAADRDHVAVIPVRRLMAPNIVLRFMLVYTIPRDALRAAVDGVSRAVEVGALTTLPLHRFTLDGVAAAHDAVQGGAVGKVVIDIPGTSE
jgi:NADPH2:quinone reductase